MASLGALTLAGCATTPPVEVTRFNLGTPIARGTIDVEPFSSTGAASLEYQTYAAAVQSQLLQLGYSSPPPGETSQFLATVNFVRTSRGVIDEGPPVSIGLGVGSFGRHVGGGGDVGFGIGKHRRKELIVSELSVQIKDRSNGSAIWEGRAQQNGTVGTAEANPAATATKLASALFGGFPGESGRTIRVK
jgi:hypothetical protein